MLRVSQIHSTSCLAVIVGGLAFAASSVVHADTIFSDFGPGNSYQTNSGYGISDYTQFMGFTSPVNADVTQIDIALSRFGGTATNAKVLLWEALPEPVGITLTPIVAQPWLVTTIPSFVSPAISTISGITGVHLNAGQLYYLSATSLDTGETAGDDNVWNYNSVGLSGSVINFLGDSGDVPPDFLTGTLGAFDIIGNVTTPVSTLLPSALPLFATGLGALGLLGWCRKKKAAPLNA